MYNEHEVKDTVALVPAAGKGSRLGLGAKAFLRLKGQSLIERVVHTLYGCVGKVVVAVPADQLKSANKSLKRWAEVYAGEASRQATVYRLMEKTSEPIILIHDVTRPFASQNLILDVIKAAKKDLAASTFVPSHIPAAEHKDGYVTRSMPKSSFLLPQSPQAYHRYILEKAYKNAIDTKVEYQTTWELIVRLGIPVRVIPGEERNVKITVPLDWEIARKVIAPSLHLDEEKQETSHEF